MVDHKVYNVDKQPDNNKVAIDGVFLTHPPPFGGATCGPNYVYSENFQSIQFLLIYTIVFAVIMTILSTPLCLICFIPAILLLNKANRALKSGDKMEARIQYYKWKKVGLVVYIWMAAVALLIAIGAATAGGILRSAYSTS